MSGAQMVLQWLYITLAGMAVASAAMLLVALVHGALTYRPARPPDSGRPPSRGPST